MAANWKTCANVLDEVDVAIFMHDPFFLLNFSLLSYWRN